MRLMRILHKWLGLIIGLQVLLWLISGLGMNLLDAQQVAGEHVLAFEHDVQTVESAPRLVEPEQILSLLPDVPVHSLELARLHGFWLWRADTRDGAVLFDARDATPFVIDAARARAIATQTYFGEGSVTSATLIQKSDLEVRGHDLPVWRVTFDDEFNTRYYVSADDGRVLERRNDTWALFDVFWMLHTMDYVGRDNFNNPFIVLTGFGTLWLSLTGLILLARSLRPRASRVATEPR